MSSNYWSNVLNHRVGRRRAMTATSGFAVGAAFLAACGGGSSTSTGSTGSTGGQTGGSGDQGSTESHSLTGVEGAKRGGTFGTFASDPPHLNIYTTAHEYSSLSGQYVYDHMITSRSNENAPWVAEAAEGVEMSPDGITITFKLREGMTYHPIAPVNGREVVAEDVVADQEYVKNVTGAENAFQNDILDRAEAPDDHTVVYKLQRPTAYLFTARMLGHPGPQAIIPPETFDNLETARQVGSGPFMLDEWTLGTRYHYVRFDDYHGRGNKGVLPYRDAHDALFIPDEAAREAAFRSEQVHFYTPSPGSYEGLVQSLGDQVRELQGPGLRAFTWNLGNAPGRGPWVDYRDTRFRQAMYRLTDRQQFVDLLYRGNAEIPTSILATGQNKVFQVDASETAEYYKYDVEEAKQLLEAMSWDFDREVVIEYQGSAEAGQACEILQQQWLKGGVKTRILSQSPSELLDRSTRGEYDVFVGGHPAYDSPQAVLSQNRSDTTIAFGGTSLNDPEIDEMITKAEQTPDFEENGALVREILVELAKRYTPYYNILTAPYRAILNHKVRNFEIDVSPNTMHRAELWFDT